VQYIGEGRTEESLTAYFTAFPEEQRAGIEAISLDMCSA
jgi:transposase